MVKNESSIIERCLKSIIPLADLVIITDTGSTDDTVIKSGLLLQLHKINYKIYSEPFLDFSTNRNKLLELAAYEPVDYVLMIDADEVLEYNPKLDKPNFKDSLTHDFYDVQLKVNNLSYHLPRLTSNQKLLRYAGVTHEYLNTSGFSGAVAKDICIQQINDSKRRISNQKFQEDAALLEKAIKTELNSGLLARYVFYLAQTYQNLREFSKAKELYLKRAALGGWKEEVFYCYYQLGKILEAEGNPACANYYIDAFEVIPERIESLAALKDYRLRQGHSCFAQILQSRILNTPKPASGLFIEEDKYDNALAISVLK